MPIRYASDTESASRDKSDKICRRTWFRDNGTFVAGKKHSRESTKTRKGHKKII